MTMCTANTPVERLPDLGLWVKREDLCCPGGPNFSKTRGVYAHLSSRSEHFIGVLDTSHSQGGWAVARACALLGKQCVEFFPVRKGGPAGGGEVQARCRDLGAQLLPFAAGRSAVLYHRARDWLANHPDLDRDGRGAYMMPNALKLAESVEETAAEVARTLKARLDNSRLPVLVSVSSGTIAAGVLRGLRERGWRGPLVVHMGYSRPREAVLSYLRKMANGGPTAVEWDPIEVVDEGYEYKDEARPGPDAPFPCNRHYDLKAFRWWVAHGRAQYHEALMWNIG